MAWNSVGWTTGVLTVGLGKEGTMNVIAPMKLISDPVVQVRKLVTVWIASIL